MFSKGIIIVKKCQELIKNVFFYSIILLLRFKTGGIFQIERKDTWSVHCSSKMQRSSLKKVRNMLNPQPQRIIE